MANQTNTLKSLELNKPLNGYDKTLQTFLDNAKRLKLSSDEYFIKIDFKMFGIPKNPALWGIDCWNRFSDAVELDAEALFYARNNL